jgi:hypothetical protein
MILSLGLLLACAVRRALALLAARGLFWRRQPPETTRSNHQRAFNAAAKPLTSTKKQKPSPRFRRKDHNKTTKETPERRQPGEKEEQYHA